MGVFEITRRLGAAIQEEECYKAFAAAKKANDEDAELQSDIAEFNRVRTELDSALSADGDNDNKVSGLNDQLRTLYSKIMSSDSMRKYNEAKQGLDALVNRINGIITLCVNGEDPATCEPSSCSGDCCSCGGCH